jgi:hypothetical protein
MSARGVPARFIALAIFALTITAIGPVRHAGADVIFDNFDEGGGFHPQDNWVAAFTYRESGDVWAVRAAARFTVVGRDYSFTSVTLPISRQNTIPGEFLRVRLTTDAGGAPGSTLEVLSENEGVWPQNSNPFTTTTTLSSAANPVLSHGASYWIVTEPTSIPPEDPSFVDYRWFVNSTSQAAVPTRQQQEFGGLPSDPWDGFSGDVNLAFRIEGTPAIVRAEVFDVMGRRVRSLFEDREMSGGTHEVMWDGRGVSGRRAAAGVYLVRVSTSATTATGRFTLVD